VIGTMPAPDPPPGPGHNTKPVPGLPDYQSAQLGNTNSLFKIKLAEDRNAAYSGSGAFLRRKWR
jgi:hypothetical protein